MPARRIYLKKSKYIRYVRGRPTRVKPHYQHYIRKPKRMLKYNDREWKVAEYLVENKSKIPTWVESAENDLKNTYEVSKAKFYTNQVSKVEKMAKKDKTLSTALGKLFTPSMTPEEKFHILEGSTPEVFEADLYLNKGLGKRQNVRKYHYQKTNKHQSLNDLMSVDYGTKDAEPGTNTEHSQADLNITKSRVSISDIGDLSGDDLKRANTILVRRKENLFKTKGIDNDKALSKLLKLSKELTENRKNFYKALSGNKINDEAITKNKQLAEINEIVNKQLRANAVLKDISKHTKPDEPDKHIYYGLYDKPKYKQPEQDPSEWIKKFSTGIVRLNKFISTAEKNVVGKSTSVQSGPLVMELVDDIPLDKEQKFEKQADALMMSKMNKYGESKVQAKMIKLDKSIFGQELFLRKATRLGDIYHMYTKKPTGHNKPIASVNVDIDKADKTILLKTSRPYNETP